MVWIMYEYMLDGNGQWSLGDILYLATSWIPALDCVLPPLVVKSKDTSTYQSHSYPFHGRRLWCDEMPCVCVIPLYVTDCEGFFRMVFEGQTILLGKEFLEKLPEEFI